jgi:DNA repair photolyase
LLKELDFRLQVVTKSDIVVRDSDLLIEMPATVSITVTTLRDPISCLLEPSAPLPERRLAAIRKLSHAKIPVSARIDPIIPFINDAEIESLVSAVSRAGARHVISSTYKARPDNWKRLCRAFAGETAALGPLYFEKGQRIESSHYLPFELRREILGRVKEAALKNGITFSTCREDIFKPSGISCDGSHLIRNK